MRRHARGQVAGAGLGAGADEPTAEAFELLPDPVVVVDGDGRVAHATALAQRLLGADPVGRPAAEAVALTTENGADWWSALPSEAVAPTVAARVPEAALTLATTAGPRAVMVTAARHELAGGVWLVVVLRRAERRQRLDAARSELVATVSHELRSPLTSVKGFSKTLLTKWERFSDEQKRHMITVINADADRVTRLLGELLDVSRIDAGRLQLRRAPIDLEAVVERVAGRAAPGLEDRGLVVDLDCDLPRVDADEDKVEQVLTNLVDNAVRYGAGQVNVRGRAGGGVVRLSVVDEGGRLSPASLGQLFEKFYRQRGERRAGTGLGLYISRGIVEAHGGRIWAESDPGRRTRFHVELPVRAPDGPAQSPGAGPDRATSERRDGTR